MKKKRRKKKRAPKRAKPRATIYACGQCGVKGHNAQSHRPARSRRTKQRRKLMRDRAEQLQQLALPFPEDERADERVAA